MSPSHGPEPICITAPTAIGFGETEVLERIVFDLDSLASAAIAAGLLPSGIGPVVEVVTLSKRVTVTACDAFPNKVMLNGVLHKDLLFKFAAVTLAADLEGIVLTNHDCRLTLTETVDLVIDSPFAACITVPGACSGDRCLVETARVESEKELLIDTDGDGLADQFEEKVCIRLQVKALCEQPVTIVPHKGNGAHRPRAST